MCQSFKSINSSSLSRKKYDGDNFTPASRRKLRGQNSLVGIELFEIIEPSDTWNYKAFLNVTFYKLFYTYIYYLYLYGTKLFALKTELHFIYF